MSTCRPRLVWLRHLPLAIAVGAALVIGFAYGLRQPKDWLKSAPFAVDTDLRLDHRSALPTNLTRGWDRLENWGVWMSAQEAIVDFGFDGPAEGDTIITVEGRKRAGDRASTLRIRYNGVELGRWQLPQEARPLRRAFVVPDAVFNTSLVGHLSFDYSDGPKPNFGLERVRLRDARRFGKFRGFLDHCSAEQLSGWAVADGSPLMVIATSRERLIAGSVTNVDRPDLAKHGLPVEAGFVFRPANSLPAGTTIELRFPDGKSLHGSPCRI